MAESAAVLWQPWVVLLLAIGGSSALGILSALLERSGPIRLRQWAEDAGGRLLNMFEAPARFEAFRFLVNLTARFALLGVLLAFLLALRGAGHRTAVAFGITGLFAVALELFNRSVVTKQAEQALNAGTVAYRLLALVFALPILLLSGVPPFRPESSGDPADLAEEGGLAEEIDAFLDVGTKEGILEPSEAELVRGIVDFGDTVVRSVMTPRIDVIGLPRDASVPAAVRLFVDSKRTRLPVYEGAIDQVLGFLHVLDLLAVIHLAPRAGARGTGQAAAGRAKTKPLNELLREFQATGQQIAVVVNEHGSTAGLVTLEDLLEEIVGEIGDEYQRPVSEQEELPGGAWRLEGGVHVDTLSELFGVSMDDPPFETVGGLVMSVLGDVPRAGDVVDAYGLRFLVEKLDGRRIDSLRVERIGREEAP